MKKPDLSIIIPTLNEAQNLPGLLADLSAQNRLAFEVIVADGGSDDTTLIKAQEWFAAGRLSGSCLTTERGRGRQLNAGAGLARADWLLFLHADSRLDGPDQLHQALDHLKKIQRDTDEDEVAGRFAIRFDLPADRKTFGYFFYETKARLGRPGCIHGDQGMMLPATYFHRTGPFREDLPVMEDTTLAERIRGTGRWVLLPRVLITSARRFETEGLSARQTLNALMMNFLAIGWDDFFVQAPQVYRQQARTAPLQLTPFFTLISDLLAQLPSRRRRQLWLATGAYVRGQAWQIGLACDCRAAFKASTDADPLAGSWLPWFDRWFDPLTDHAPGRILTALLVRLWFAWQCRH